MRTLTRGTNTASGKTALIRKGPSVTTWAQFDDIRHPHAYRWHLYFRRDFKVHDLRTTEPWQVI